MPSQHTFREKGLIYAEVDGRDIDKAIDDAIEAGAEDAEKLKEDDKEFIQVQSHKLSIPHMSIL